MPDKIDNNENGSSGKIYVIKTLEKLQIGQDQLKDSFHKAEIHNETELTTIKTKIGVGTSIIAIIVSFAVSVIAGIIIYNYTQDGVSREIIQMEKNNVVQMEKHNCTDNGE